MTPRPPPVPLLPSAPAEQPQIRGLRWLRANPEPLLRGPSRYPAAEALPRGRGAACPGAPPPRGRAAPAALDEDRGAPGGQRVAPLGLPQRAPRRHGPVSSALSPVATGTEGVRAPEDPSKRAVRPCPPPRGAGLGPIRPRCLILAHPDSSGDLVYVLGTCAFRRQARRRGACPSTTSLRRARFP